VETGTRSRPFRNDIISPTTTSGQESVGGVGMVLDGRLMSRGDKGTTSRVAVDRKVWSTSMDRIQGEGGVFIMKAGAAIISAIMLSPGCIFPTQPRPEGTGINREKDSNIDHGVLR